MCPSRDIQSLLAKKTWVYEHWKLSDSDFDSSVKYVTIFLSSRSSQSNVF